MYVCIDEGGTLIRFQRNQPRCRRGVDDSSWRELGSNRDVPSLGLAANGKSILCYTLLPCRLAGCLRRRDERHYRMIIRMGTYISLFLGVDLLSFPDRHGR